MSPLVAGIEEPAAVECADVFLPLQCPIHVVADYQSNRPEYRNDVSTVGDRCGIRLTGLEVTFDDGCSDERVALPHDLTGRTIQRVQAVPVRRKRVDGCR